MQIASEFRYARTPEGGVLLNTNTGKMYDLNRTSARLWAHLEQGIYCNDELIQILEREFSQIPPKQIAEDVRNFLQELIEVGVLLSS